MKSFRMYERYGSVCGDGGLALELFRSEVLPAIQDGGKLEFDFGGVRVVNSSFANALFSNLAFKEGEGIFSKVVVSNTTPLIKTEVMSGIFLGLARREEEEQEKIRQKAKEKRGWLKRHNTP